MGRFFLISFRKQLKYNNKMKQLFETEELIGKTIKKAINPDSNDEKMFLFFEDETFCILERHWDCVEISENEFSLIPNNWNHDLLFELEIINESKYSELKESIEKEREVERKKQDLEMLKKLQEKYGSVSF